MGKPTICIGEIKDADQLRGNRKADQRLCFRYLDSTIPLLPKSKIFQLLAIFCDYTAWFVSDLVRTQIVGFSTRRLICIFLVETLSSNTDVSKNFTEDTTEKRCHTVYKVNMQITVTLQRHQSLLVSTVLFCI